MAATMIYSTFDLFTVVQSRLLLATSAVGTKRTFGISTSWLNCDAQLSIVHLLAARFNSPVARQSPGCWHSN